MIMVMVTDVGGVPRVIRCIETPGNVSAFMKQEPRKVAASV
jgi:hypothetical protein